MSFGFDTHLLGETRRGASLSPRPPALLVCAAFHSWARVDRGYPMCRGLEPIERRSRMEGPRAGRQNTRGGWDGARSFPAACC